MIEEDKEENILQDAEYSQKTDYSKGQLVWLQTKKCCDIRSKEMRDAHMNYDKFGNKVLIPDARREYISAVDALMGLLRPEILRSPDFLKKEKEIKQKEKDLIKVFGVLPTIVIGNKITYIKGEEQFIPELNESFPVTVPVISGGLKKIGIEYVSGIYNTNFHCYWNRVVKIYDELFAEINVLADQNQYFKKGSSF